MNNATRIFTSTFGAVMALAGIEHGIGEALQGNVAPAAIMIQSWPDAAFFSSLNGEPALTLVPNLLISGILTILVSLALLAWSTLFIRRKHGGLVMILISVALLLVGGGIFPPLLGAAIGAAGMKIDAPLSWWRTRLSAGFRCFLAGIWPWSYAVCILSWFALIPGIGLLNRYFSVDDTALVLLLSVTLGSLLLTVLTGFARDTMAKED